jgi:4-amino-4-deoxy-L-arabinose transferase-like glycosyltransferase
MKRLLLLIVLTSFALFFFNVQGRDFWAPDEGDFAQIAREMEEDLIVPHLNGEPYGEKPPLFYYAIFLFKNMFPGTKDELSLRIPTALSALLCAAFFFIVVTTVFGLRTASMATGILITAPLYYWQARYLQVDMLFAVFISSSILCFLYFYQQGRTLFYYLFFAFLALAFLTKGPLAVLLVFPVVIIWLITERDKHLLTIKETYLGILLFFCIVLPWYLAIYAREGFPFLYENIVRQNITRFLEAWSHRRPPYYYFATLPLDFFPWSLFLPAGIYLAFSRVRQDNACRLFLIWFLWMFLFFSLSSGKISKYMLPLLPAISVVTSLSFLGGMGRYNSIVFSLISLILVGLCAGLFLVRPELYPEFWTDRLVVALIALATSLVLLFFIKKRLLVHALCTLFLFMTSVYTVANMSVFHKLNRYKSPRVLSDKIRTFLTPGIPWVYYGSIRGVYIYYAQKRAIHINEHRSQELSRLGQNINEFYLLTRKRDIEEVRTALGNIAVLIDDKVGDTPMIFVHYSRPLRGTPQ